MGSSRSKTAKAARDQKLIDAVRKHFSGGTVVLAEEKYSADGIIVIIQQHLDALKAAQVAHAKYMSAIEDERAKEELTKKLVDHLRHVILGMYGSSIETLADFGFTSRKRTVSSTAAKLLSVERARATRAARHTVGPKQRLAIKGEIVREPMALAQTSPKSSLSNGGNGVATPGPIVQK